MINWIYTTGIDISVLITIILLIRQPVRNYLGANIVYWFWSIPLFRLLLWEKSTINLQVLKNINHTVNGFSTAISDTINASNVDSYSFFIFWIFGLIVWVSFRIYTLFKFHQSLKQQYQIVHLEDVCEDAVSLFKNIKTTFYLTNSSEAPFITGLIKVKIYLPYNFYEKYSSSQKLCILRHELSHLKRKDLWSQFLAEIVLALFWFNPLMHFAFVAFKQDQEIACDYQVLAHCNNKQRYEYGKLLLNNIQNNNLPAILAFFNFHKKRFTMIEKHNQSTVKKIFGLTLCALITFIALTKAPDSFALGGNTPSKMIYIDNVPEGLTITKVTSVFKGYKLEGFATKVSAISHYMSLLETTNKHLKTKIDLKSLKTSSEKQNFILVIQSEGMLKINN